METFVRPQFLPLVRPATSFVPAPVIEPKKPDNLPFIEANTKEVSLEHLTSDCIIPVFSKDNEVTISHQTFIDTVMEAARQVFPLEAISSPAIRVSHIVKGRIPEAIHKPVSQLLETDKTIYYERMMFCFEIPTIYQDVNGCRLNLTIGGVRAYNEQNLNAFLSKHPHEIKTLTLTYRCGQNIANYVNGFRFTDCPNYQLKSTCLRAGEVDVRMGHSEADEALDVLHTIKEQGELRRCAVLCNNLKYLSTMVSLLIANKIPYKVFGGRKLLKKHIRFLNHVLRVIDTDNAYSIRRVAQYARIDIMQDGKRKKSLFFASTFGKQLLAIRQDRENLTFRDLVQRAIHALPESYDEVDAHYGDYQALLAKTEQFTSIQDYLATFATDRDLFAQFYDADYEECPFPIGTDYLTVSTIHSAKGLEWDRVFIMGLCEGNFPNDYFCQNLPEEERQEFFNNEWKKMYVAATRAKDKLQLSYSRTITRKGHTFKMTPSRFITTNHQAPRQ